MDGAFLSTLLDRLNGQGTQGQASATLGAGGGQGHGQYTFPSGLVYEGNFSDGVFDGRGTLTFPNNGGRFEGVWQKGKLIKGKYFFSDNLEYRPRNWQYCTDADRRFWQEIQHGIQLGEVPAFTNQPKHRLIPVGCFDIGDGTYYNPFDQCLYSDDGTFLRVPSKAEAEWAIRKARISTDDDRGMRRAEDVAQKEAAWFQNVDQSAEAAAQVAESTIIQRLRELGLGDVRVPDKLDSQSHPDILGQLTDQNEMYQANQQHSGTSTPREAKIEDIERYHTSKVKLQNEIAELTKPPVVSSASTMYPPEASVTSHVSRETVRDDQEDATTQAAVQVLGSALAVARRASTQMSQGFTLEPQPQQGYPRQDGVVATAFATAAAFTEVQTHEAAAEDEEDAAALANFATLGQSDDLEPALEDEDDGGYGSRDDLMGEPTQLPEAEHFTHGDSLDDGYDDSQNDLHESRDDGAAMDGLDDIEAEVDPAEGWGLGVQHDVQTAHVEDDEEDSSSP